MIILAGINITCPLRGNIYQIKKNGESSKQHTMCRWPAPSSLVGSGRQCQMFGFIQAGICHSSMMESDFELDKPQKKYPFESNICVCPWISHWWMGAGSWTGPVLVADKSHGSIYAWSNRVLKITKYAGIIYIVTNI